MRPQNMSEHLSQTQKISYIGKESRKTAREILLEASRALSEKGYDPVVQIVGYLVSGDPTYITAHRNARSLIVRLERDELMEEVVKFYLENN